MPGARFLSCFSLQPEQLVASLKACPTESCATCLLSKCIMFDDLGNILFYACYHWQMDYTRCLVHYVLRHGLPGSLNVGCLTGTESLDPNLGETVCSSSVITREGGSMRFLSIHLSSGPYGTSECCWKRKWRNVPDFRIGIFPKSALVAE